MPAFDWNAAYRASLERDPYRRSSALADASAILQGQLPSTFGWQDSNIASILDMGTKALQDEKFFNNRAAFENAYINPYLQGQRIASQAVMNAIGEYYKALLRRTGDPEVLNSVLPLFTPSVPQGWRANQAAQFYSDILPDWGTSANVQQAFGNYLQSMGAGGAGYMPLNQMQNLLNPLLEVAAANEWTPDVAATYYGLEGMPTPFTSDTMTLNTRNYIDSLNRFLYGQQGLAQDQSGNWVETPRARLSGAGTQVSTAISNAMPVPFYTGERLSPAIMEQVNKQLGAPQKVVDTKVIPDTASAMSTANATPSVSRYYGGQSTAEMNRAEKEQRAQVQKQADQQAVDAAKRIAQVVSGPQEFISYLRERYGNLYSEDQLAELENWAYQWWEQGQWPPPDAR
jgi:hypothetical protein